MRLKDIFWREKTPGFGINSNYYLSVLSCRPVLPSLRGLVRPKLEDAPPGTLQGFGVPLSTQDKRPELLDEPLRRGSYAIATLDRKTLIRMMVLGVEEAHFDPKHYATSSRAIFEDPEVIARMRGAWTISQLSFESFAPSVFPSLEFFWKFAARLAELGEGVVADPMSERYLLPHQVYHDPNKAKGLPIDLADLLEVKRIVNGSNLHVYTLGLQKLNLPEFEICGLRDQDEKPAVMFLYGLCQTVLKGHKVSPGDMVGCAKAPFTVAVGGLDRKLWEGISCFELLPPSNKHPFEGLSAWFEEQSRGH